MTAAEILSTEATHERPRPASGNAILAFERVRGRTVATRMQSYSPLRLTNPRNAGTGSWVFMSTFGGGLLAGDDLSISADVGAETIAYLSSQSANKIYRSEDGRAARQALNARIQKEATLIITPDPVCCFAGARYEQHQRIEMTASSGLVLLDWFASGRHAAPRNESWQFAELLTRNEIFIDNKRILTDVLRLSNDDGPLTGPFRMGRFHCHATLVILGTKLHPFTQAILQNVAALPVRPAQPALLAASPLHNGLILRLATPGVELARRILFDYLGFLEDILGEHPWKRKW